MKNQTKKVMRMVRFVEEMKLQRYPNAESFCELLRKSDERNDETLAVSSKTIGHKNRIVIKKNGFSQRRKGAKKNDKEKVSRKIANKLRACPRRLASLNPSPRRLASKDFYLADLSWQFPYLEMEGEELFEYNLKMIIKHEM